MRRRCSLREPPGRAGPATEPSPRSPIGSAPASSATSTASSTVEAVPAPRRQVPGVHRARRRSPPHPAHPRHRGRPGGGEHRPPGRAQRRAHRGGRHRPRLRSRAGGPRRPRSALSPFLEGGYHHAVYGADVVLAPLNLCAETLDAIRNHSWNRPAPSTPEGEVVAWADRIAYVCHDFEDAVAAGIVRPRRAPRRGARRRRLRPPHAARIGSSPRWSTPSPRPVAVGLRKPEAEALAAFRSFNYERIYLRPEAQEQADRVIDLLQSLTSWFVEHPDETGDGPIGRRVTRGGGRGRALRQRDDRPIRVPARGRAPGLGPRRRCPEGRDGRAVRPG